MSKRNNLIHALTITISIGIIGLIFIASFLYWRQAQSIRAESNIIQCESSTVGRSQGIIDEPDLICLNRITELQISEKAMNKRAMIAGSSGLVLGITLILLVYFRKHSHRNKKR